MAAFAIPVALLVAPPASAVPGLATLPGSSFEIDEDSNLKLDNADYKDWGVLAHPNGPEIRATDETTGQTDDSYKGGVKEDTECPGETTGSIPNNKSDLLTFHVYKEAASDGNKGFLNLAWSRVSDPSGTTLMDFEFNQSKTPCPQGPNKVRTGDGPDGPLTDDLLIEYAIDQGGARADILARFWTGSAWSDPAIPLDEGSACGGGPCAVGTISSSVILDGDSDGLGTKQARTFGEAQIDLRLIFDDTKCSSFGSAMLKSRSSDAFTSQLKDFISPREIDLKNCGQVIIRKQTLPDEDPNTTLFDYTKAFGTDPATDNTFQLTDDGVQDYGQTVLFGTGYTVEEGALPTGWAFKSLDCSASSGVTPSIDPLTPKKVTFAIDDEEDVLDCTYTNEALGTVIIKKVINDGAAYSQAFDFSSGTLPSASFTLTPTGTGNAGSDSETFNNLSTGTVYDASETVPANWNLVSSACEDGDSTPAAIKLDPGETVTCTFTNAIERGVVKILKERKHAADGAGDHPHAGVTFTLTGGDLAAGDEKVTDVNGEICWSGLAVSALAGNYSVAETVPAGYVLKSTNPQGGIVVTEGTCGDKTTYDAEFLNMPLTNLTVSVDSQIDGGTASTIECALAEADPDASTDADGDGSFTKNDLEPGTYTCTVVIDP
ncbi:prealbumin-like fold domain-containing protein [Intrasporangium calvum]|uniref:Prealbumin-like fold domain-containing protein n=1 Tax=Intrasporangium calvum TaxID=53358 RepID=A0ABT5GMS0_9MICO|nr:SpaA isopeptide-forming pilin-related protein [Intrasporangium calvum]MDC5699369.1 prealbumin-like fold domain-containing protein [Intrasporangium calvum]